ncbi:TolC family protein [Mucilaginibacter boryungensis]|uniref:TolC family protein n=1 Tax=Mucilaginibacter boryungensis TaxID=768480 RepID=A0ABR9XCI3_9SPHI|nr:TolC family protein [Mucilaginibacter boryungensis]MBE9664890.1 TolC family protein [Mucilaginibacter boryungensis]
MHKKILLIITFLSALFISGNLYAQTAPPAAPYTATPDSFVPDISYPFLQKLIDTAKKYYPEVRLRQKQVNIANTSYHQAQLSWFDIITPSYLYNPSQSTNLITPIAANSYQLAVTVNLGSLISKPFIIHNAKQAVDVALYQQQEYMLTLEATVKKLYFTYLGLQADLRLRSKAEQDAGVNVNLMKYKFTKGEAILKDYNDAMMIQYTQVSYRIQGELAVFNAKVNLEEIVGKKLEDIK